MKTIKIYSLTNFYIQHTAVLIMFIMLNVIFLLFILQLKVWSFNCLHLISVPLSPYPAPLEKTNLISFSVSFLLFLLVVFEIRLTYNIMLVPITQHSVLIFLYILNWSPQHLVIMHHHTRILHGYWLCSPYCTFHTCDSFVLKLEVRTS